ncbi:ATP-dependent metallopeptidase FtsH/Yme1/Tma family protein [Clostridium sp. D2Q-14]|uniref:ATP-dependent metallopeptidase FtsH/Yme1/Tma family protein n=1 Tax=Anaeromonas gelatinilytica TaxID=2683194 RepID=UPI00193BB4B1|nr:ATP-dependent metallopeptidase FtsH/Yme1/Tma family protein [Anaeromonas gelatinilytica]MBS4534600.1 ATP-dependent metallopeptidase FtsH/Yme1/Tma family protein [Anaeromonas gelatinilytica]
MNFLFKRPIIFLFIFIVISTVLAFLYLDKEEFTEISYTEFTKYVEDNKISRVIISSESKITGKFNNGENFITDNPRTENFKESLLLENIEVIEGNNNITIKDIISGIFILGLVGFLIYYFNKNSKQAQKEMLNMSQIESNNHNENIKFDDVAGNEEAKERLMELVDFLKNPEKYEKYGARIPRGVLLYGAPGTGKTLLAKALAGEANVDFKAISGSDFVQVYAGVGASRVRNLFKNARKEGKCVIFIDEIDALGKKRRDIGTSSDESDRTLNALLTEMSGFSENQGIIVVAATNRIDTLDDALLRPGRFDRQIEIGLPDVNARKKILDYHSKNKPIDIGVDLEKLAYETVYFSGAKLENLLNESAMIAAKDNNNTITSEHIDKAFYQVIAGEEKKDRSFISPLEKKITAYHESGHGLVTKLIAPENKVTKITIIPSTKGAGGFSMSIPPDKMYHTKEDIIKNIKIALAGRIAEEIIFGKEKITTGASNDLERVTKMVISMITRFGMDDKIGLLNYETILPNNQGINSEVLIRAKDIVSELYESTKELLQRNIELLNKIAIYLIENESIDEIELNNFIEESLS